MNENKDFWQENSYSTGATNPPPVSYKWLTILVVAVIILGGIAGVLGVMNIQLFRQVSKYEKENARQPHFYMSDQPTQAQEEAGDKPALILETTPVAAENLSQTGGLPLQQIYNQTIDSVVSVSTDRGTGSGVVLDSAGHIVTNSHVVRGAKELQVRLGDNRTLPAILVGDDPTSDLAVLYVEATDLKPAHFGDSSTLQVGDSVVAIGDPLGLMLRGTMTDGIISAINRDISTQGRTMTLIQTNAALNAGNSGGPLINCYGQVIGINTMKIGDSFSATGVEGIGFAIPSVTVKEVVDQLINQGFVSGRPALGLTGETVSSFLQHYYRLPAGVYVTQVTYGGAAHRAGLTTGDIILSFGDKETASVEALTTALYTAKAGDKEELVIFRSGRQQHLELTVGQAAGK